MENNNIVFGIDVNTGKAAQSFAGVKQELRSISRALAEMDPQSKAFETASKRAGELKMKLRDVNDAIENADPEKKFAPFVRTLQGVAGGFAAAQGAAALFGSESEDLQKTLVKVQGAMALSQGLNSLLELRNDFGDLAKIISTKVVSAFTTLRGALMGTGILLIASAVATLAANWEELLGWIEKSFPAFKKISAFFSNFKQMASGALASVVEGFKVVGDVVSKIFSGDFSGAIKSAKEFGSRVATAYNEGYEAKDKELKMQAALKERKFAIDMAEAQGKDVLAIKLKYLQDELTLLEKGSEEYNAKLIEIEQTRTEIRKKANEKRKHEAEEAAKKEKERLAKEAEDRKLLAQAETEAAELKVKNVRAEFEGVKSETDKAVKDVEDMAAKAVAFAGDEKQGIQERQQALDEYYRSGYLSAKQYADATVKLEQEKTAAQLNTMSAVSSGLTSLSALAGDNTAASKALGVASATIDTYVGANKAFAQGGTIGFVTAAAVIASGLANVKRILSVKVPKSSNTGSIPSASTPTAPQFNQAIASSVQGSGDITLNKPQKVYVVESDIRKTMNKVDVIEQNSKISG